MTDQRELEMQFNYISGQIEEARRQLGELRMVLQEAQETLLALAELETKPKSTMVALGSSVFVSATLEQGKVIAPIGTNVFVKQTPQEAMKSIEQRASKLNEAAQNIEKTLSQMASMRQKIMQQAQESQQNQQGQNE